MRNVYIGVIFVTLIFAIMQVRAGESSSLNDYYATYKPDLPASIKEKQSKHYNGCKPYGNDTVGYFKTEEEYINALVSSDVF